jgi:lipopolysaccharide/colanic/teichoic acid biosynthesis glycosyltransferase
MEPDILASPKDDLSVRATLPELGDSTAATPNGHVTLGAASHAPPATRPERNGNGNGVAGHAGTANGNGVHHDRARAWAAEEGGVAVMSQASIATVVQLRAASSFYLRSGKRILDVIGAAAALVITAPVLLIAALAIKLESRGPVLYRSTRIGRGGRAFTFLKLRSMVHNADQHRHRLSHLNECDGPVFKINRDPRVTRVGRFLRVTSIDEIPQFVNVLMGQMSLVGPRPPIPEEVAQYEPWQLHRLDVRPGITCLWQISGRSRIGFQEWMRLDLEYIRQQSFALDMNILVRTVPAVLSREGAY